MNERALSRGAGTYAHDLADVVQNLGSRRVDELRLLLRTMISPQNDIPFPDLPQTLPLTNRNRLAVHIGHSKRARRIEPQSLDGGRRDVRFRQNVFDDGADASPDVGGGLLEDAVVVRVAERLRFLRGRGEDGAVPREEARADAPCPDVDSDVILACHEIPLDGGGEASDK